MQGKRRTTEKAGVLDSRAQTCTRTNTPPPPASPWKRNRKGDGDQARPIAFTHSHTHTLSVGTAETRESMFGKQGTHTEAAAGTNTAAIDLDLVGGSAQPREEEEEEEDAMQWLVNK